MTKRFCMLASLMFSFLSLCTLFYGAYLFDAHIIVSRVGVFVPPTVAAVISLTLIGISYYLKD